jgi:hypothetical protein
MTDLLQTPGHAPESESPPPDREPPVVDPAQPDGANPLDEITTAGDMIESLGRQGEAPAAESFVAIDEPAEDSYDRELAESRAKAALDLALARQEAAQTDAASQSGLGHRLMEGAKGRFSAAASRLLPGEGRPEGD